jgi:UDP-N-acetylmuramoyl-L-alanyl-D-glutamate--2,6-diaminopimelate ligase
MGLDLARAVEALGSIRSIPGRLEKIENRRGIHLFVDYAHTPDALANVLNALLPFRKRRLIAVFGCGGDRDRLKRPLMARVVAEGADVSILTSDNPRSENPIEILREIEAGQPADLPRIVAEQLNADSKRVACSMADRRQAIATAIRIAQPGDLVLIAGKGHETYQEVAGARHPFDDREVARSVLGGSA